MPESTELTQEQQERSVAMASLTERELQALRYFSKSKQPELSTELSDEMFVLFGQGRTCDDIRKLRGPAMNLGAIVHARVRDLWDKRLQDHQSSLVQRVPQIVQQTQLESAEFISKLLAGAHKLLSDKIDQYLATGESKHLVGTPLEGLTLRQYQQLLTTLATATGQDQKKTVHHTGGITFTPAQKITPANHAAMFDAIEGKK
jgi:hypothetical protein